MYHEYKEGQKRKLQDVPSFVRAVHALVNEAGFDALSEEEKLEAIFGHSPGWKKPGARASQVAVEPGRSEDAQPARG